MSTTPILAWAAFSTSIPLSMIAQTTVTIMLHRDRCIGSNVVRVVRTTKLKITTASDIGRRNYPPSISGGTLTLLAEVLVWTATFSETLTLKFVNMAPSIRLLASIRPFSSCLYRVTKKGSSIASVTAPRVKWCFSIY